MTTGVVGEVLRCGRRSGQASESMTTAVGSDPPNILGYDYHGILGLDRSCSDADVRRAFRELSLRYHPDRKTLENGEDRKALRKAAFSAVAEAYEVLSDPLKRSVYEEFGEEGLKRGLEGPNDSSSRYVFHGEPLKTYREFFATENPYADLLDSAAKSLPSKDCPEARGVKRKDEPVIKALPLTLREVFYGEIKKMKIQRRVLVESANKGNGSEARLTSLEEKIFSIPVTPGIPTGAKIVFPGEGDQGPSNIPGDVVFVIEDKPDETFKRDGSNLRMTVNILLKEALTGTIVTVRTIDDRILRVPITSVISPDYAKMVPGEGLPLMDDRDKHGDLIIDFKIEFPVYMTPLSKYYIQKAFDPEDSSGDEDDVEESEEEEEKRVVVPGPTHRMNLAGKMYLRTDKLSQMYRP